MFSEINTRFFKSLQMQVHHAQNSINKNKINQNMWTFKHIKIHTNAYNNKIPTMQTR